MFDLTFHSPGERQLLLVLWKTLLGCCGGMKDLHRVKKLAREVAGLPPTPEGGSSDRKCSFVVIANPGLVSRHCH